MTTWRMALAVEALARIIYNRTAALERALAANRDVEGDDDAIGEEYKIPENHIGKRNGFDQTN